MLKKYILALIAIASLPGCFPKEEAGLGCEETGVVANSGSNWVFAVDSGAGFRFATKYPLSIHLEIFDSRSHRINTLDDSIDSKSLVSLPVFQDSLRLLAWAWNTLDKDGKAVGSGCYGARMQVQALLPALAEGDVPRDAGSTLVMEWRFSFIRDRP